MKSLFLKSTLLVACCFLVSLPVTVLAGNQPLPKEKEDLVKLENPVSVSYLKSHLRKVLPDWY